MEANRGRKSVLILESKRFLIFLSEQLSGQNLALQKSRILFTFFIPQGRECKLLAPINLVNCIFLQITATPLVLPRIKVGYKEAD